MQGFLRQIHICLRWTKLRYYILDTILVIQRALQNTSMQNVWEEICNLVEREKRHAKQMQNNGQTRVKYNTPSGKKKNNIKALSNMNTLLQLFYDQLLSSPCNTGGCHTATYWTCSVIVSEII